MTILTAFDSVRIISEEWKPIQGYEGVYEVSCQGNVRSLDRFVKTSKSGKKFVKGRLLKPVAVKGYSIVSLCLNGHQVEKKIHRLVANAFLDNPFELPQVNHLDGNKTNNNVSNLEFCSPLHNVKHAFDTGLCDRSIAQRHYGAKLKNSDIPIIRSRLSSNESPTSIAKDYSIGRHIIYKIKYGKSWESVK